MMYFISKLYIKNNLLNTTKYKNECFFFSIFKYRIRKWKIDAPLFESKEALAHEW